MGEPKTAVEKEAVDLPDFTEVDEQVKKAGKTNGGKKAKAVEEKPAKKKAKAEEKPAKVEEKPAKANGKKAKAAEDKPEKKAKKEKVDDDPAPKDVVKWPYRRGSAMDYVFRAMYKGVGKKAIEKEVTAAGNNWANMLKIMQRPGHREHNWKLNEEGTQYKIYDVKYLGSTPKSK